MGCSALAKLLFFIMKKYILNNLSRRLSSKLILNPKLSNYSWWKIGGYANCLIDIESIEDLKVTTTLLKAEAIPYCIIGEGTNILFDDAGFDGCIIRIGRQFSSFEHSGDYYSVESGYWVPKLAVRIAKLGYSGLEHVVGIPASLGGLVAMNGGSKRKSISEFIESVVVLESRGSIREDVNSACGFNYRTSRYQLSKEIILKVNFRFKNKKDYRLQRIEMLNILRERSTKFPRKLPSCGSVFKSSPELYENYGTPGSIIENLGFKGLRRGDVQVSELHANFIVNLGGGSSNDILELVREIHSAVLARTGTCMVPEFLYVHPNRGITQVL